MQWRQLCKSKYLEVTFQADCYCSHGSNMAEMPPIEEVLQTERKVH